MPTRREYSAALFGNSYVVDVVMAIGRLAGDAEAFVTTRTVASDSGLADSLVRPVMLRLVDAGLLVPLARPGGSRSTLPYQVQRDHLWSALAKICAVIGTSESTTGS